MPLPPDTRASALTRRGRELIEQGSFQEAQPVLEEALALWRDLDDRSEVAQVLRLLGLALYRRGAPLQAQEQLAQALAASRELNDPALEADVLVELGQALAGLGETQRAVASYQQARQLYLQLQAPEEEGLALYQIGKAYQAAGDMQAARTWFAQAFPLLRSTAGWTAEVAQTAQHVETVAMAQSVFSTLGKRGRPSLSDLRAIPDLLRTQAGPESDVAAHLAERVDALVQGMSSLTESFAPRRD